MKIIDPAIAPYEIHIDEDNYSVVRTQISQKGKSEGNVLIFPFAYCSSLESAVTRIIRAKVGHTEETHTLETFIERYKHITKEIRTALKVFLI